MRGLRDAVNLLEDIVKMLQEVIDIIKNWLKDS
jgi:hypothetical protein